MKSTPEVRLSIANCVQIEAKGRVGDSICLQQTLLIDKKYKSKEIHKEIVLIVL